MPRHVRSQSVYGSSNFHAAARPAVLCVSLTCMLQTRSQRAIQERMLRLTESPAASPGPPSADALLCLSGSHPARKLPGSSRSVSTPPLGGCPLSLTNYWRLEGRVQLALSGGRAAQQVAIKQHGCPADGKCAPQ